MKKVFKYPLPAGTMTTKVRMPRGAELLHVAMQHGDVTVWALVDDDNSRVNRRITVIGTGWDVEEGSGKFVGTAFDGAFVWHVFDGGEE